MKNAKCRIDPEDQMQRDELSSKERFRDALAFWTIELVTTMILGAHALLRAAPIFHSTFCILHFPRPAGMRLPANPRQRPGLSPGSREASQFLWGNSPPVIFTQHASRNMHHKP